ncbi:elongation factor P 5-aminopentanone reductase [Brevibacillus daliensis]|uniref:elongation factor P 5-aminopentanone reductase n=1 Tax=Brevibacillus daliensis TaxID=2892995 RepID=UPI001E5099C3|nr:SDR family oxidoreductase [Brevibacillus daliensis]
MGDERHWALVTGASGEIGRAIAKKLAEAGYHLYVHYHTNVHAIEELISFCRELGVEAVPLQADLGDPKQIRSMFTHMPIKPLSIINNASIDHFGLVTEVEPDLFDQMVRINMGSCFFVSQAAIPAMLQNRFGRIVTVSSIWGETGASCEVLYSMTKGAVLSFTKALAKELAPNHITVNVVSPGAVAGGMMSRFNEDEIQELCDEIPAGRLAEPSEIAEAVLFLLSDKAGYINGHTLSINGGWHT